jgi:hypothetical protein
MTVTFEEWLATLRLDEPDEGGQVGTLSAGALDFFREVFAHSGPVSKRRVEQRVAEPRC